MACFTRPELKVERVSYEVMTPSAARGILEAILWKPAIHWVIDRIHVLAPIRWGQIRRNEVSKKLSESSHFSTYCADEDRAQRNTLYLRNVDYVLETHFEMTERAGPGDNLYKFIEMFQRRLERGQYFHQPYLGCREFAAEVSPAPDTWTIPEEFQGVRPLGLMLWDIVHNPKGNRLDAEGRPIHFCEGCAPAFFEAKLQDGVLETPAEAPL
jgi:CRISPR-associated protein Cas5d